MPLNDFYKGTTKKFNVGVLVQNVAPDISTDTMKIVMFNSGSNLVFSSSADCTTSGSSGVAVFAITDDSSSLIPADIYQYEIIWAVSASSDTYVLDSGEVYVKPRII